MYIYILWGLLLLRYIYKFKVTTKLIFFNLYTLRGYKGANLPVINNSIGIVPYLLVACLQQKFTFTILLGLNYSRCYYSSDSLCPNRDNLAIIPVRSYLNADIDEFTILQDNKDRIGIYR